MPPLSLLQELKNKSIVKINGENIKEVSVNFLYKTLTVVTGSGCYYFDNIDQVTVYHRQAAVTSKAQERCLLTLAMYPDMPVYQPMAGGLLRPAFNSVRTLL